MDKNLQRELDFAGMPASLIASDRTTATVLVPRRIEISNENLVFDRGECARKAIRAVRLLDSFVSLWQKGDDDILGFASKYGVLELDATTGFHPAEDRKTWDALLGNGKYPEIGREPIGIWRRYSQCFWGLLMVSAKLHRNDLGKPEDWKAIEPKLTSGASDVATAEFLLELKIEELVLQSNLRPVLKWPGETAAQPCIMFGSYENGGLFAVLVFHLMLAIARADGLATCGSCQKPFAPATRARRGDVRFCKECRLDGSAHRVSVRNNSIKRRQPATDSVVTQRDQRPDKRAL